MRESGPKAQKKKTALRVYVRLEKPGTIPKKEVGEDNQGSMWSLG